MSLCTKTNPPVPALRILVAVTWSLALTDMLCPDCVHEMPEDQPGLPNIFDPPLEFVCGLKLGACGSLF